jgi:hypothetical protein
MTGRPGKVLTLLKRTMRSASGIQRSKLVSKRTTISSVAHTATPRARPRTLRAA